MLSKYFKGDLKKVFPDYKLSKITLIKEYILKHLFYLYLQILKI